MLRLVIRTIVRRPLRNGLAVAGVAGAIAVLVSILALGQGYGRALSRELESSGVQMMLVPLGCPYDAAARVLKNRTLETSLPAEALERVRSDPDVAVAAPLLMAALPRPREGRTDLWVGIDRSALELKPWWRVKSGQPWFSNSLSNGTNPPVILGSEAAVVEMRKPGDKFFSPETGQALQVVAVLERSGTSDDNAFFVPLATAQNMFNQTGRLTAVAIRLHDPAKMREVSERLERIPGAQVVTMTEMTGVFLNLLGTVRTFVLAIAALAITVSALSLFNTLLAGVFERANELALLRAIGASRAQIFSLLTIESLVLTASGGLAGLILAASLGPRIETWVRRLATLAPSEPLLTLTAAATGLCLAIALAAGLLAAVYPAWRASRLQPALATKNE